MSADARIRYCAECGEAEEDHGHAFEPIVTPPGCVCDPRDWGDHRAIPVVCASVEPNDAEHLGEDPNRCFKCEHDLRCHGIGELTTEGA